MGKHVLKKIQIDKDALYDVVPFAMNIIIAFGLLFIGIYFIAYLSTHDFSLFVNVMLKYGSWIAMAIAGKIYLKQARIGMVNVYTYLIVGASAIVNFFLWFKYPLNIFFIIVIILVMALSYYFTRRNREE